VARLQDRELARGLVQALRVVGPEHGEDTVDQSRRPFVDGGDDAAGDRGGDDRAVDDAVGVVLVRVAGRARHLLPGLGAAAPLTHLPRRDGH
jgi:hypothetical protein